MPAKINIKLLTILAILLLIQAPRALISRAMPRRRPHHQNTIAPFLLTPQKELAVLSLLRPSSSSSTAAAAAAGAGTRVGVAVTTVSALPLPEHHVLVVVHLAFQAHGTAGRGGGDEGVLVLEVGGEVHGVVVVGRGESEAKTRRRGVGVQVVVMRVGVEMGRGWEGRGRVV